MKSRRFSLVFVLPALLVLAGCAAKKNNPWDMYALPNTGSAPYDNDYYYRAPVVPGTDLAKRCNSIGDMPSCGGD